MMRELIPGVIVAVPLSQSWVFAVGCVMASQSVSTVVGHCIEVIHRALCREETTQLSVNTPAKLK